MKRCPAAAKKANGALEYPSVMTGNARKTPEPKLHRAVVVVDLIEKRLKLQLVDSTGLQGAFDFALKWTPENAQAKPAENAGAPLADAPPGLFTAIEEQPGLKLEPRKAPLEFLVVDYAEKVPTEN